MYTKVNTGAILKAAGLYKTSRILFGSATKVTALIDFG